MDEPPAGSQPSEKVDEGQGGDEDLDYEDVEPIVEEKDESDEDEDVNSDGRVAQDVQFDEAARARGEDTALVLQEFATSTHDLKGNTDPEILFLDEFFNLELAKKMEERPQKSAPFRTNESDPSEDPNDNDKYIPLITKEAEKPWPEPFDEKALSEKAYKRLNIIFTLLIQPCSRIAVKYRKGATLADTKRYTHSFSLIEDNLYILLELLAPLRRGDVWSCTTYGDVLYHTPFATHNIFRDPNVRQKSAEEEAEVKLQFLEKLNKKTRKIKMQLRIAEIEAALMGLQALSKTMVAQSNAIQTLLMLSTQEKFNHEMVGYLRDNMGNLTRKVDGFIKSYYEQKQPEVVAVGPLVRIEDSECAPIEAIKEEENK